MESKEKISLELVREALKQADANINFEDVKIYNESKKKQKNNQKVLKKGDKNGTRLLG